MKTFIKKLEEVGIKDVIEVGGKNASLGEMIQNLAPKGINIPGGFIVTATAYRYFLKQAGLTQFIKKTIKGLDTKNLKDLERRGKTIRETIKNSKFPKDLEKEIVKAYKDLEKKYGVGTDVAVRSSATAEDLPGASFAGEHETYLNIRGQDEVLRAVKSAMASLFTNRAISYRVDKNFDHFKIALSVGVEKMARSDLACSGVIFTLDTESGFPDVVLINGSWGLGEMIVQGEVTPDEFLIFKKTRQLIDKKLGVKNRKMIYSVGSGIKKTKVVPTSEREKSLFILSEKEILQLANWALLVEDHYSKKNKKWTPMDLEWAKDGKTKELFIVQARPETVHASRDFSKIKEYVLDDLKLRTKSLELLAKGTSVGTKIASGKARVILSIKDVGQFKPGEVLVTDMTDPDWEPIMKIASAIVTDKGGRTSHAAIVSRELGIPCIVGTENAARKIKTGQTITVDTTSSEGLVYSGALKFKIIEHDVKRFPKPKTKIMMNIATPDTAFEKSFLPNSGVGLAREEFIIASNIGIHPLTLINYGRLPSKIKKIVDWKTVGWKNKTKFYVDKLAYGIAKIGAAFYPKPVIVRFSDFKTNEYRALIGGEPYEPKEENPMLGWRGASRYYHENFAPAFALECKAIQKVREEMGLDNIEIMIPFCRTVEEGKKVLAIMEKNGLKRKSFGAKTPQDDKNLKVFVMCEIPSNILLADEFLEIFDGMSIGSNDLTQLTVGIDRDASELLRDISDERDSSVKKLIAEVIKKCREKKKYIGICGDAPSTFPEFTKFLIREKIESLSLNPDTIIKTSKAVYEWEKEYKK